MSFMVRTRFAPSPTGFLHIGGVRTALFNWLFARKHGGQFILRIDDTDAERNVAEALAPILHGFRWLGIDWDEGAEVGGPNGPYYQSQKLARYQAAVRELVERGYAYADQGAVRLEMPDEGYCEFFDHVRGEMKFPWAGENDHVIQRANGSCLYNLASVVDDFDMKITHVIRAEEHLSNTPRQIFILRALGYPQPEYAHLPFVAAPGGKDKLSKRKLPDYLKNPDFRSVYDRAAAIARALGLEPSADTFNPVIVDFYEQLGYLPHAILNYIVRLGWSKDDTSEIFTRTEMIRDFSLERVGKGPAAFDIKKLNATQEHYMQQVPLDQKVERCLPFLRRAKLIDPANDTVRQQVCQVIEAAAHRIVIAGDILDYAPFFVADAALTWDDKAFEKHLRKPVGATGHLAALRQHLAGLEPFDPPTLEATVKEYIQATGAKPGDVNQALRVATTGKGVGFGTYETLAVLGRARCLARIDRALSQLSGVRSQE
jgi:glutamyl-tRNA synthetase